MTLRFLALALVLTAPALAQEQGLPKPLSLQQASALKCSAAFAIGATMQARGQDNLGETGATRVMLTTSLEKLGRYDQAIALADQTIAMEAGAKPTRDTVAVRNAKATALLKMGRTAEAKRTWDEALALVPSAMGTGHPNYAVILANSAKGDLALGDLQGAKRKLEEALAALKAKQGPGHPRTREAAATLAETYDRLGMRAEAAALRKEFPAEAGK